MAINYSKHNENESKTDKQNGYWGENVKCEKI